MEKIMPIIIKYKTVILLSMIVLLFISILFIYCSTFRYMPRTLDVGPGQTYSTDGIDDQIEINNAINATNSGDIVYIHAGTYSISAPINVTRNNIVIKGNGPQNTFIQASSYNALYGTLYSDWDRSFIELTAVNNDELYGFTLKGVYPQIEPEHAPGHNESDDSENGIILLGRCTNNKIHDINFTLISNNGIKVESDNADISHNSIYNCVFNTTNHDCIEFWNSCGWHIYNCSMNITSDCGIRFVDSRDSEVSNCTMYSASQHENGGVYFQNTNHNITLDWNVFRDMYEGTYSAIYTTPWYDSGNGDAKIHHNVFYNNRGTATRIGYAINRNIFAPNMELTLSNNLYPTSVFDWTAEGYGYGVS